MAVEELIDHLIDKGYAKPEAKSFIVDELGIPLGTPVPEWNEDAEAWEV